MTDWLKQLDGKAIDLRCPGCKRRIQLQVRQLRAKKPLGCPKCGADLDASEIQQQFRAVNAAIDAHVRSVLCG